MDETNEVKLFIYDLSQGMASLMSGPILGQHIEGIWHTSIVVFGKEYFYGAAGIQCCTPCSTVLGQPTKIEKLGDTCVPFQIFKDYLRGLSNSTFKGSQYNLLQHNCNIFSEDLSQFLCGIGIPKHILDLPQNILSTQLGQTLVPLLDRLNNDSHSFGFEPRVPDREASPGLEDLNNQIEEVRLQSLAIEQQRQKTREKIAKRESKKGRNSKKHKPAGTIDEEPSSTAMSEVNEQMNNNADATTESNGKLPEQLVTDDDVDAVEEERKKNRIPPIVFRDIDPKVELEELVKILDGKISKEEECSVEELHQYLIEDEGSWTLGDNFLVFVKRILQEPAFSPNATVHLIRILAVAALKDDVILLLHQDRKDHVLMNYSQDIDKHTVDEQKAWALFMCNLFENINSSEWLLYISEWPYNNQNISNIQGTTKVAVHSLLATDNTLQDIGSSIIYNLAIMEVKTVIFDDVAVEITMAILQFFNSKPSEEHIFRTVKALLRFVMIAPDVGQFIQMIGPHPIIFKGSSTRVDEIITEISKKVPAP